MGRQSRGRPRATNPPPSADGRRAPGGTGPGGSGAGRRAPGGTGPGGPGGRRALWLLNPRKTPTKTRVRNAAALFAVLALVLGVLGLTLDRAYLQPALLTALLALLWGVRAATMR